VTVAAVCPGSYDPITLGHLDLIGRAAASFDRVVVAVLDNPRKQATFSVEERIGLISAETDGFGNVEVDRFQGLLVDFCHQRGIGLVCKGLRGVGDLEYELQMAQMNRHIGAVETVLMPTNPRYSYVSSSLVKEIARSGGPLDGLLPEGVRAALEERLGPGAGD
jgi:pantetheine-phosphate adenylyltransferase